ncbi:glycosyl hydrolase [Granulicella paludicola]|uniref:glycosyl hydrolase n=1 Tax=Granulicella paludicola TaxID=474951 RepID=UPI0021E0FB81|nr:glycosyl hydrolase [Granulicella paludicola]
MTRVQQIHGLALLGLLIVGVGTPMLGQKPAGAQLSLSELRAGFVEPPPQARLRCYWWWLNGHTDKATITHDLEEMRAKGFGGALLVDANGSEQNGNDNVPAGPTFGSPEWVGLYTHTLREADRLGLEITLNITSGWNLGGPDVTPEQASKLLTWARVQVTGGTRLAIKLPVPESKNGFYRQIAVLAYPLHHGTALQGQPAGLPLRMRSAAAETGFSMTDSSSMLNAGNNSEDKTMADTSLAEVVNVSSNVDASGTLTWDAPAGNWEVLRIGYTDSGAKVSTASGAWQGLAIDYMSREAFDAYWDHTVEPLMQAAKPFHSLKYLATDSWELGGTNWTKEFATEFKQRRGYDPVPWLPVVAGRFVGDREQSERFLADLRRTVADLVVSNHYDVFAEHAAKYGLGVQAESGGPHGAPIDALETFRHAAVPQSEFWSQNPHRATDPDRFFTKEAASAANIYGQHYIAQEGETSIGPQWSESLATDLKPSFDMAITEGMNRLVWHEFTSSPAATGLPGQEYFAGTHLNPKVTWWNAGSAFFTYLNRAQFMMQQGVAVNDVLYFDGDNVPNFVRLKADDPAHVLPGYDYDVTNQDAWLRTIHMEGAELVGPSGVRWRALALPKTGRLSLEALQKAERYAQGGGTLIGVAPLAPTGLTTVEDEARYRALIRQVWGEDCIAGSQHTYGKGHVICNKDTHAALQQVKMLPDVDVAAEKDVLGSASDSVLDYVHRRIGSNDIYYLRNGSSHASKHEVIFRAKASAPEFWDAVSGEIHQAGDTAILPDGRTKITVNLPAYGSVFVVFPGNGASHSAGSLSEQRTSPVARKGPWVLRFQADRGAPYEPVTTTDLKSWTEFDNPGIRYFSGSVMYSASVTAPVVDKGEHVWLRFTDVREIACVKVNGHDAGTVWAKPLMLRVDPFLKAGENTLEIEVTNLWPNRIIGDQQPGTVERYTKTNITTYRADSPLLPSGLIGPVEWVVMR